MDEIIQRERERDVRVSERLRRSQTQENTLINSGEKKSNGGFMQHGNGRILPSAGVIDDTTIFIPKCLAENIANSQPPKVAPRVEMQSKRAGTVPKNTDGTWSNGLPRREFISAVDSISFAQIDILKEDSMDGSGIIKCKTCDLCFKEYKKPQYNEIEFLDGDKHCDVCFN